MRRLWLAFRVWLVEGRLRREERRQRVAEVIACRDGGPRCRWCQARIDEGLNPYTGHPA